MQVLDLDALPEFARRELMGFYQFLLQKYAVEPPKVTCSKSSVVPRLVKPFGLLKREDMYE
jgi:hypothetical protein